MIVQRVKDFLLITVAEHFEEIHPDGSKVVKIVGDDYEIVAGSRNCYVKGSVNLTVDGNVRQLIKGDYVLEVEGDYTQKIHKNKLIKVGAGEAGVIINKRYEELLQKTFLISLFKQLVQIQKYYLKVIAQKM